VEVHASSRSHLDINPDAPGVEKIPSLSELRGETNSTSSSLSRSKIKDIDEGIKEIRGAIVNITDGTNFYDVCPNCGKKVYNGNCADHGDVEPKHSLILSTIMDDGSDNMRVVFFREQAEAVLGMSSEEAYEQGQKRGRSFFCNKSRQTQDSGERAGDRRKCCNK